MAQKKGRLPLFNGQLTALDNVDQNLLDTVPPEGRNGRGEGAKGKEQTHLSSPSDSQNRLPSHPLVPPIGNNCQEEQGEGERVEGVEVCPKSEKRGHQKISSGRDLFLSERALPMQPEGEEGEKEETEQLRADTTHNGQCAEGEQKGHPNACQGGCFHCGEDEKEGSNLHHQSEQLQAS
ncbi:MAG: hypothetical protein C4295_06635 [Candidatus Fervidibacterota bacterium]